jgi:PAS domain-containing protein
MSDAGVLDVEPGDPRLDRFREHSIDVPVGEIEIGPAAEPQLAELINRALDQDCPVLILYADADENDAPLEEVAKLAAAFSVPVALFARMDDPERLTRLLGQAACFVISADREDLLMDSVNRLITASQNERNQAARQQRLEELEHRYDLVLDSSRDAIAYIHEGLHVYSNRAYLEALRVNEESALAGLSLLEMVDAGETNLKTLLKGFAKGLFPSEALAVKITRPDGSQFEASLTFSPAQYDGEDCTQMMMQRRDAANELAAELERLRFTDQLTQLHNRKAFVDVLEADLAHAAVPQCFDPRHRAFRGGFR